MSTENRQIKDCLVLGHTSDGFEIHGSVLRLSRYAAVFEVYSATTVMRLSDALEDFKVLLGERTVYSGRALVTNVVNTGAVLVCEVKLEEAGLHVTPLKAAQGNGASLRAGFEEFLAEWQQLYHVRPEFKLVMGDMETFLSDLRLWLEQVELEIRASPSANRQQLELQVVEELAGPVVKAIDTFVERFERIAEEVEAEWQAAHRLYLRRHLHPLLLCSPFAYRTYYKPLGYAGDYQIVDMMLRPPAEGSSLFAKLINVWLLGQAPAQAHRHRVDYLERKLTEEALRAKARGRPGRVYNLGCGPATEVQRFLRQPVLANLLQFSLLDFNEETLAHARARLEEAKRGCGAATSLQFTKRSVQQVIKEAGKSVARAPETQYDVVYCAGLFDYLSDAVCKRLMNVFYDLLAPDGLLIATNVSDALNASRPFRHSMEYMLDWHLVYRNGPQLAALAPAAAPADNCKVIAEDLGVNVFLEVRKPQHA